MKLLVTGGAGFIGSAVVRDAVARGHEVINVDCLTYASNLASLNGLSDPSKHILEKVNICDSEAIRDVFKRHQPDKVMHLAAESHVDRSIDGPGEFIKTNIVGTFELLAAAREYYEGLDGDRRSNFRFHHVSTDEVYGDLTLDDPAFTETTPYDPSSPYSASKAASDHLVRAWGRTYGLPVVITNCSNNYGPYQFPEKLIPVVILKALHRQAIPVYGTGENVRDWLHVHDHSDALLLILEKGRLGQTYNIGGENEKTNLELVHAICAVIDELRPHDDGNHSDLIEFVTDRPGHDQRYAINAAKLRDELGWRPSMTGENGVRETVSWYIDNEEWWRPLVDESKFGARLGLKARV